MYKRNSHYFLVGVSALVISLCTLRNADAELLAVDFSFGNLYRVSTSNAALTLVGNTGFETFCDIGFSPSGKLYGFTGGTTSGLYTINPATAESTFVGLLGLPFVGEGGLTFAPNGTAYGAQAGFADNPQLFTINLETGAAAIVGTISGGSHDINGLLYRNDGKLIGLDRVSNSLLVIDPVTAAANQLAIVSAVVGGSGGMTTLNGINYYSTSGATAGATGSNSLYSFNPFTGASTKIGSFGNAIGGFGISGLAAVAPEPSAILLAVLGITGMTLARRHFIKC